MKELDVLYVSPAAFRLQPQIGTPRRLTWVALVEWLSRATVATPTGDDDRDKRQAGGWSPALYLANHRCKSALVHACAMTIDVDGNGDIDPIAQMLANYRAVVHPTYKSKAEAPRCRIVIDLAEPIDTDTYERTHAVLCGHLESRGLILDKRAKDASRLSFAPMVKPGAEYRIRTVIGAPLNARAVLSAQPPERPPASWRGLDPDRAGAYESAALRRAARAIAGASPGERHPTLNKEAFSLARFDLTDDAIMGALLPAFVSAAGEARRREGERTIRDAIRARRRGG